MCITLGLLIAAVTVNGTQFINSAACYQIPIAIQFIWAAILGVGLLFLPESPRWLLMKGREEEALTSISRLAAAPEDDAEVQTEFEEMSIAVRQDKAVHEGTYADCFRNGPGRHGFRMWTVSHCGCHSPRIKLIEYHVCLLLGNSYSSSSTTYWSQLHLLLWYSILLELWYPRSFHHHYHHLRYQHRLYCSWNVRDGQIRSTIPPHVRSLRNGGFSTYCRHRWFRHFGQQSRWTTSSHRFRLYLHCSLRCDLVRIPPIFHPSVRLLTISILFIAQGMSRLGCYVRDLPHFDAR